jgi:hypothetical protein
MWLSLVNARCFKKLYYGIPNTIVWRVLRKRLHLKDYKLSMIQHIGQWIVCRPSSVYVFIKLATQQHLKYHCEALF